MAENVVLERKEDQETGFVAWMGRPETKLILSLLPPAATDMQKDCLTGLLRSAYDAGFNNGGGSVAAMMLRGIFDKKDREGQ